MITVHNQLPGPWMRRMHEKLQSGSSLSPGDHVFDEQTVLQCSAISITLNGQHSHEITTASRMYAYAIFESVVLVPGTISYYVPGSK